MPSASVVNIPETECLVVAMDRSFYLCHVIGGSRASAAVGEGSDRREEDPEQQRRAHRAAGRSRLQALGQRPSGMCVGELPPRQARTRTRSYREWEVESGEDDVEPAELRPAMRRTRGMKRSYRDDSEDEEEAWAARHEPAAAGVRHMLDSGPAALNCWG